MKTKPCPCGTNKNYLDCCGRFIEGEQDAATPLELMRSRYTAYTIGNINYIQKTQAGGAAEKFKLQEARDWSKNSKWLGLTIIDAPEPDGDHGIVEFIAKYKENGKAIKLQDRSQFKKINGRWYYV